MLVLKMLNDSNLWEKWINEHVDTQCHNKLGQKNTEDAPIEDWINTIVGPFFSSL